MSSGQQANHSREASGHVQVPMAGAPVATDQVPVAQQADWQCPSNVAENCFSCSMPDYVDTIQRGQHQFLQDCIIGSVCGCVRGL